MSTVSRSPTLPFLVWVSSASWIKLKSKESLTGFYPYKFFLAQQWNWTTGHSMVSSDAVIQNSCLLIQISGLNTSNLASTYCALAILKTIGYNLADIKHEYISTSIGCLQQSDGSFIPVDIGGERDLRFVYCAAAICHMLNDWSCLNIKKAKDSIISCQSYDGGFGLTPGSESHGGATYCAVAALRLMGFIPDDPISSFAESCPINLPMLLEWLLHRQAVDGGFQGRANKASDTCYAFWVGGVLTLLGASNLFNKDALCKFLHSCQFKYGGFSKNPGEYPDLYHSYFGYSAFSLLNEPGLDPICVELGITVISALGTSNM